MFHEQTALTFSSNNGQNQIACNRDRNITIFCLTPALSKSVGFCNVLLLTMFARSPLSNVSLNSCNQIRSESRLTAPAARGSVIKKKNVGRWHEWERLAFLRGLRRFGRGKWKKISKLIPTRYVRKTMRDL